MDFLDPKKQRRHTIILYTGYVLIAIAILISTVVLVYQANGFGVTSNGQVVQNGLVFFSSQPNPADIYMNGKLESAQTNTRLSVPAGQYAVKLTRAGYRDWQRTITVQGGDVQHFDYPVLFPQNLTTKNLADLPSAPGIVSQSRDQRWLLVQDNPTSLTFELYDLKNPSQSATQLSIPGAVAGTATGAQSWAVVQWADDNQHVLLVHNLSTGSQYIELDRTDASKSINLNQTLGSSPTTMALNNTKYDQYELFDAKTGDLSMASLSNPKPAKLLGGVLAYKTYGNNMVLYATADDAPEGKVNINIRDGNGKTYLIRQVAASTTYLLDMAEYSGTPYVVIGAASDNIVYVYKDPVGQLQQAGVKLPSASRAFRIPNPTYVAFSPTAQFVVAESGTEFGVYDVYLKHAYQYTIHSPMDAPQGHANWMDGDRLDYVTGGKFIVFDYDQTNYQPLEAADPAYQTVFSPDYHYAYSIATAADGSYKLTQTALLTAADL